MEVSPGLVIRSYAFVECRSVMPITHGAAASGHWRNRPWNAKRRSRRSDASRKQMPDQPISEQSRWDTRFRAQDYIFGKEPNAFLKAQARRLPSGGTALSVADGEGRNGVWLAEQGLDVLTIDYSPAALTKARALAAERGVRLRTEVTDVFAWSFPKNTFDVVAAIFIFAGPAERPAFFANLKAALKPGGLLLMQGYRPEQLKYPHRRSAGRRTASDPRDARTGFRRYGRARHPRTRQHDQRGYRPCRHVRADRSRREKIT